MFDGNHTLDYLHPSYSNSYHQIFLTKLVRLLFGVIIIGNVMEYDYVQIEMVFFSEKF